MAATFPSVTAPIETVKLAIAERSSEALSEHLEDSGG